MKGVVAAGHPLTARGGAEVLRAGGNAVDAAVAAVLTSFAAEPPLTGPGAGGFMLVAHGRAARAICSTSSSAPGARTGRPAAGAAGPGRRRLSATRSRSSTSAPASCGVYGTPPASPRRERFGTRAARRADAGGRRRRARDGRRGRPDAGVRARDPRADRHARRRRRGDLRARTGACCADRRALRIPELGRRARAARRRGPRVRSTTATSRRRSATGCWSAAGCSPREDLAAYEVVEREPVRARYRGREVLTNPPPSSGGILIAYALELLERLDRPRDAARAGRGDRATNRARDADFVDGLRSADYAGTFLAPRALDQVSAEIASRLGLDDAHLAVVDGDGACATVTCSNGSCSGVVVPGTGIHLNNMLGEEDLNPLGFHRHRRGARAEHDGADDRAARRRRRAGARQRRLEPDPLGDRPDDRRRDRRRPGRRRRPSTRRGSTSRATLIDAEPGVDPEALDWLAAHDWNLRRWQEPNLYFGGVQAVVRDAAGGISGGGDPRRGGAVHSVE